MRNRLTVVTVLLALLALAAGILTNIATGVLPEEIRPHLGLAWPLLVLVVLFFAILTWWQARLQSQEGTQSSSASLASDVQQKNRQEMFRRVRVTWIAGVLEQSLQEVARIELGLHDAPDAVSHPFRFALEQPDRPARRLRAGIPISEVYDQTDGSLLILGAPGAGKTTLLLELARTLLDRAERDPTQPLPVVFHLSRWAAKRLPLAEWLVAEFKEYHVPEKVARPWVEHDQLLLLLDGLDEVAQQHRAACVQAINAYRREHGMVSLVVCSRETEYRALNATLDVGQAVVVQPLEPEQVDDYLAQGGPALARVRSAFQSDEQLRKMLDTPLMLNIVVLAYGGLPPGADILATRQQIFAAYVDRMLKRRAGTARYSPQQTSHWLAMLARQMAAHNQTVFYIEWLQPDWLAHPAQTSYKWLRWVWGLFFGLVGGLVGGLVVGVVFGLYVGRNSSWQNIVPAEVMTWSSARAWQGLRIGQFFGLVGGLVYGLGYGQIYGLVVGLVVGLVFGLFIALFIALVRGFSTDILDQQTRNRPNQGVWNSARNGWIVALVIGLVVGQFFGLVFGLVFGLAGGLTGGLVFGLVFGLAGGLVFGLAGGLGRGWIVCIAHVTLRFMLWLSRVLPLNLVPFLDHAVERILLRKVGGGYIFTHRLLLEHFAGLQLPAPDPVEQDKQ